MLEPHLGQALKQGDYLTVSNKLGEGKDKVLDNEETGERPHKQVKHSS
jgi:hypothetical protein